MAIQGFVVALLAVAARAAAASASASVEPPTDVKLECKNFQNVVRWNYSQYVPGLKFKVFIGAVSRQPREIWVDPPNLHADISSFSEPDDDYYVSVTAVVGGNESEESDGIMYSYFMNSLAKQKCFLDFPQVNVTAQDDGSIRFHFTHPWMLYRPNRPDGKSRKKKSHDPHTTHTTHNLPELNYEVTVQDFHKDLSCSDSVCEAELNVDPPLDTFCLKLSGEMKKVNLTERNHCTKPVPAPVPNSNTFIFIMAGILLGVAAFAFILFMVYRKKTVPSSSLPSSMTFTGQRPPGQVYQPFMVPFSPTPLLPSPGDTEDNTPEEPEPLNTPITDYDGRLRIGVDEDQLEEEEEAGQEEGHDAEYQSGRALDEEEPSCYDRRAYETRERVLVELEAGEEVEGYRS